MLQKNEFQEREFKFDISGNTLLPRVVSYARDAGWININNREINRFYEYFDTPELNAYRQGSCIRRVRGFSDPINGTFRYDAKAGPIEERFERTKWSNHEYSPRDIVRLLSLPKEYDSLKLAITAYSTHEKFDLRNRDDYVEVSFDHFTLENNAQFSELEIEHKSGSIDAWNSVCHHIMDCLNLTTLHQQKYSRIIELVHAD